MFTFNVAKDVTALEKNSDTFLLLDRVPIFFANDRDENSLTHFPNNLWLNVLPIKTIFAFSPQKAKQSAKYKAKC